MEFNRSLTKVFMGPAGTISRLHHDTYASHVWLSQVRGRKQFIVYPPEDSKYLEATEDDLEGRTSLFDPSKPDFEKFPHAMKATCYSVVVEEGETVVLPSQWWHWAKSLTPSVTLMRNFVNETNIEEYMRIRQKQEQTKVQQAPPPPLPSGPPPPPRDGFKTSASGLQHQVVQAGAGRTPSNGQVVRAHYTGWLGDFESNKKFDSSLDRGRPLEFPLGVRRVIPAWDEAVQDMKVGERRRLVVPPHLGYGDKGAPPTIPGGATLYFDVELASINAG